MGAYTPAGDAGGRVRRRPRGRSRVGCDQPEGRSRDVWSPAAHWQMGRPLAPRRQDAARRVLARGPRFTCETGADASVRSNSAKEANGTPCRRRTSLGRRAAIWRLLLLKLLLELGEAWPPEAQRLGRGRLDGHIHHPSVIPARWGQRSRREAPTVALRGLAARSRVHVFPYWLNRPACAGTDGRAGDARTAPSPAGLSYPPPLGMVKP
jgi:hypothetical protein